MRYHLDTVGMASGYDPVAAGVDADLTVRRGPLGPIIRNLDPGIAALSRVQLTDQEFEDLVAFLRTGLLDRRALPANLCGLVPGTVPSGLPVLRFQGCRTPIVVTR